jgi:predicted N-formylglutamate amidohydrolase
MDLGILYDPSCRCERELAHALQQRLQAQTSMRIRCNAPYKGISDGFVTALRKRFSPQSYVGLELEVNQGLDKTPLWRHVWLPSIIEVLKLILGDM